MGWVRLDDQFHTNDKAVHAGTDGRALYIAGLCWCARNLTDGYIDKRALPTVAALAGVEPSVADTLSAVDVGLWEDEGARYRVPDYLDYHPSRQQVVAERAAAAERKRKSRRESRRDVAGSHAVSSAASVPIPKELSVQSSNGSSHRTGPPRDDDEQLSKGEVPDVVWEHYARRKLAAEPAGKVKYPQKWLRTTRTNARHDLADQAARWWTMFTVDADQLAGWLIDGQPHPNAQRREATP